MVFPGELVFRDDVKIPVIIKIQNFFKSLVLSRAVIYPLMLIFGTITAVTMKLQLDVTAVGLPGYPAHSFSKPWFENIEMFGAMSFCIFIFWIFAIVGKIITLILYLIYKNDLKPKSEVPKQEEVVEVRVEGSESDYLIGKDTPFEGDEEVVLDEEKDSTSKLRDLLTYILGYVIVAIPATFDLLGSGVMTVGTLYTTVSVMQMLRGSMVVFSAVLSIIFLKRKLRPIHFVSIFLIVIALSMVGASSILSDQEHHGVLQTALGCSLVLFSQVIQSCQIVAEEFLMKNVNLHPLLIVGMEGVWGFLLSVFIMVPVIYFLPGNEPGSWPVFYNRYENTLDTLYMIYNDKLLWLFVTLFMIGCLGYNIFGMMITFSQSAIMRTMMEAVRTSCVWVTDLMIYYIYYLIAGEPTKFGEYIDKYSILQLGGFLLLFFSIFLYEGVIPVPGVYTGPVQKRGVKEDDEENGIDFVMREENSLNSS